MECRYRKVINNILLTEEEAMTLYNAMSILLEAKDNIECSGCEYDKDLLEAINECIGALSICNGRLDVNIIVETTEWE